MVRKNNQKQNQEKKFFLEDLREFAVRTIEETIREKAIEFVSQIMLEEVESLCGVAFKHKKDGQAYRAGSEKGSIVLGGQRFKIKRPRVRKDGKEVQLITYSKLHCMDNIQEIVFKMMMHGTSTRSYDEVLQKFENDLGISKSTVSRQFIKKSRESLNEINTRKFPDKKFWAIMIDGISIGDDVVVVVLGIDIEGNKRFLGISQGSTENSIVVSECLNNLRDRDIQFTDRVVVVLDGSKALHKAVTEFFGKDAEIQRCLNHKVRNVEAKLKKKYHYDFLEKVRQAYGLNDYEEAKESFKNIVKWLKTISLNAGESLEEGLENILTLHRIGMPVRLRKSFYTTNLIESAFSHPRFKMKRVKNWIKQGDMIKRWAGATLSYQEKKFRKVRQYSLIENFLDSFLRKKDKKVDKENVA